MKRKIYLLFVCALLLTGCDKYQKDTSYVTNDIYGTYKQILDASDQGYKQEMSYIFNKDNSYNSTYYEEVDGEVRHNTKQDGVITSIDHINSDVTEVHLRSEDYKSNNQIYQYKNMLGDFYKTYIPDQKHFNLFVRDFDYDENSGYVFTNKGVFHHCTNYKNCTDDTDSFYKYKKINNIIYFDFSKDGHYYIRFYVVDGGIFEETYTKQ